MYDIRIENSIFKKSQRSDEKVGTVWNTLSHINDKHTCLKKIKIKKHDVVLLVYSSATIDDDRSFNQKSGNIKGNMHYIPIKTGFFHNFPNIIKLSMAAILHCN